MSEQAMILLGPQKQHPTVGDVVRNIAPGGLVATITAGWQDRESEHEELHSHLARPIQNLSLYTRAERVWTEDPPLRAAHKRLQDQLRLLRRVYQVRLASLMSVWLELMHMDGDPSVMDIETNEALEEIRTLDARHLSRIEDLRNEYELQMQPLDRPAVQRERTEIAEQLSDARAIVIAGGHVAVLVNRLRLFNVMEMLGDRPIIAWSAGAMAMADRVVLFHDHPPQGPGFAEVFDRGFGKVPGIVPLPHAGERLQLNDPDRVRRLSMRFEPTSCVTLDYRQGMAKLDGEWHTGEIGGSTLGIPQTLRSDGQLEGFAT